MKWAENFCSKFISKVQAEYRESMKYYSSAILNFLSKDFSGALADLILKKIEELSMTEGKTLSFWETYRKILAKPSSGNPTPGSSAGTGSGKAGSDAR